MVGLRLLRCCPGFIQAVNTQIAEDEVRVAYSVRTKIYLLLICSEGLVVVAQSQVDDAQVAGWSVVARVRLRPQLIGLARRFQVSGDEMFIVRNDVELLAFA